MDRPRWRLWHRAERRRAAVHSVLRHRISQRAKHLQIFPGQQNAAVGLPGYTRRVHFHRGVLAGLADRPTVEAYLRAGFHRTSLACAINRDSDLHGDRRDPVLDAHTGAVLVVQPAIPHRDSVHSVDRLVYGVVLRPGSEPRDARRLYNHGPGSSRVVLCGGGRFLKRYWTAEHVLQVLHSSVDSVQCGMWRWAGLVIASVPKMAHHNPHSLAAARHHPAEYRRAVSDHVHAGQDRDAYGPGCAAHPGR